MARTKCTPELQAELDDANEYIEQLETKLDSIAGIAAMSKRRIFVNADMATVGIVAQ